MNISLNTSLVYPQNYKINSKTMAVSQISHCSNEFVLPSYAQCVSFRSNINSTNPLTYNKSNVVSFSGKIFSTDKTASIIKEKIDKQLMNYTEDDIKRTINEVMQKLPNVSREKILRALSTISSFSNYASFSKITRHLQEEGFSDIYHTSELTLNNIAIYLSKKNIIRCDYDNENGKTALFVDKNTIEHLKNLRLEKPTEFANLKKNIAADSVRPILIDGWEAKTKDGYRSFNAVGAWGNLAEAVADIVQSEENIGKKSIYLNYLYDELVKLFGDDFDFDIIRNSAGANPNEKLIADRLNSATITKEQIKNKIIDSQDTILSKFPQLNTDEIQQIINDFLINTITVYSPRRMAKELKELNGRINEQIIAFNKDPKDALFIAPIAFKSFDLANYQYSRVNNIPFSQYVYLDKAESITDRKTSKDNTFVFCDDFSGSGASLLFEQLRYQNLKRDYRDNHMIFAPLVYTRMAQENIEDEIKQVKLDIKNEEDEYNENISCAPARCFEDCYENIDGNEHQVNTNITIVDDYAQDSFMGNSLIKSYNDNVSKLPVDKQNIFGKILKASYGSSLIGIGFMHIVPDNCSNIAAGILDQLLVSFKG